MLNKLSGVGPATSSALLACYCPEKVAFMSDEALKCTSLPLTYTLKNYLAFNDKITEKLQEIGGELTVNDLQQALWSSFQCEKGNITRKEEEENESIQINKKRARTTETEKPPTKRRRTKK